MALRLTIENKAASLATSKVAFSVFDVSALRLTITHIDSDGTKLFEAPPVMPRTKGQEARPLVTKNEKKRP
eukprot:COSAG06_NODE_14809_length_1124_cov_1.029268_2_plen_70_part_01